MIIWLTLGFVAGIEASRQAASWPLCAVVGLCNEVQCVYVWSYCVCGIVRLVDLVVKP